MEKLLNSFFMAVSIQFLVSVQKVMFKTSHKGTYTFPPGPLRRRRRERRGRRRTKRRRGRRRRGRSMRRRRS